jgi:Outer membrane protein beta-barrel domain
MSPHHVKSLLLRASYFAAILAFVSSSSPSLMAQSSKDFSSSTDMVATTNEDASASPSPPTPAIAGGQSDGSYGSHHNGILSLLALEFGAGANGPTSDSSDYITWGANLTIGAGLHILPHTSLLTEYQYIDDKLPGRIISQTGADGGHAHIWSFTLAPVIDLFPHHKTDVYITGGGGFYRKVTSFTDPVAVLYCNYYYCGVATVDQVVGHFSSNQGGWNVGGGMTHRLGDGRAKLYAEVRYLDIDTPAVTTQPNGLGTTTLAAGTKLIPITLGVRW